MRRAQEKPDPHDVDRLVKEMKIARILTVPAGAVINPLGWLRALAVERIKRGQEPI